VAADRFAVVALRVWERERTRKENVMGVLWTVVAVVLVVAVALWLLRRA